jgi:hypothetical protein
VCGRTIRWTGRQRAQSRPLARQAWALSAAATELYRQAVTAADVRTEPEIVMTWTVEGLDDGHGWRATT